MSRICEVTGKSFLSGNNVSHSNRKTRRTFLPNLHKKRFWLSEKNRWVSLRISKKGLKMIEKFGLKAVLEKIKGKDIPTASGFSTRRRGASRRSVCNDT